LREKAGRFFNSAKTVRYNIDNSRLKKILSPTDFSELSVGGVVYACQLAKDAGAEVIIFNVVLANG